LSKSYFEKSRISSAETRTIAAPASGDDDSIQNN
jgi:hypothetical protein